MIIKSCYQKNKFLPLKNNFFSSLSLRFSQYQTNTQFYFFSKKNHPMTFNNNFVYKICNIALCCVCISNSFCHLVQNMKRKAIRTGNSCIWLKPIKT